MITYEALQYRLPIITTQSTGSIVRDGLYGRIVLTRDSSAISEALLAHFETGTFSNFNGNLRDYIETVKSKALSDFENAILSVAQA